jgi:hypothetical protein
MIHYRCPNEFGNLRDGPAFSFDRTLFGQINWGVHYQSGFITLIHIEHDEPFNMALSIERACGDRCIRPKTPRQSASAALITPGSISNHWREPFRVAVHYSRAISFNQRTPGMNILKSLTFAALAGLPLAIVPALAQNAATTTQGTPSGTTLAVPGTVNNTTSKTEVPNPTQHRDSTGQTTGTRSSAAGGGG